jgi:hypothetical protein
MDDWTIGTPEVDREEVRARILVEELRKILDGDDKIELINTDSMLFHYRDGQWIYDDADQE